MVTLDWQTHILGAASKYSCLAEFEVYLQSYEENTKTKFVVLKSDMFVTIFKFNKAFRKSVNVE